MRYLAFDIECCDGKHICEFGYVITEDLVVGIYIYLFQKSSIITVRFLRHIMTTLKTYWNILSRLL